MEIVYTIWLRTMKQYLRSRSRIVGSLGMPLFFLLMNFVIFPIFGLSGALFPIDSLPAWVRALTLVDPLTYGVEGIRYGLAGTAQVHPFVGLLVLAGFTVLMLLVGAALFRKITV